MNCPNCGTWNPEDKLVCWRCQTPLPRPEPKKERIPRRFLGMPLWIFVFLVLFLIMPFLYQCAAPLLQSR